MVFLVGVVSEQSVHNAIAAIMMCSAASKDPITLVVSTYGGAAHEMFGLYDVMKYSECPIHTVGMGKIMSAGVLILAAGSKGHRQIGAHASLMMHPVSSFTGGNVFQMESETKETHRLQKQMETALMQESQITPAEMKKIMKSVSGTDSYFSAEDCVRMGIVDKIMRSDTKNFKK